MITSPAQRLADLRAAQIVNLPTPRRRNWSRFWIVFCAAFAICCALFGASGHPGWFVLAMLAAMSAYGWWREAREMSAQLRSPQTASYESFDEPTEGLEAGGDALQGVGSVAVSGSAGLIEVGVGFAFKLLERLWRRTKPRQLARLLAAGPVDLQNGERPLVICRAVLAPHGWRRLLTLLTFGLAWPFVAKRGVLTLTDRRLLLHRRKHRLHLSAPLADLEVIEWFEGSYTEARKHVLILRGPDGRIRRLNIDRFWAEEAQLVFDVVASSSSRPPAFLAARWVRWEGRADHDLERQLGEAAAAPAPSVA